MQLKSVIKALPGALLPYVYSAVVAVMALTAHDSLAATGAPKFDFTGYPKPGETQMYKGRMLVGSPHPAANNKIFFRYAKKAIDLTESLPKALQKGTGLVRVFIYNPDFNAKGSVGVSKGVRTQANDGPTGVYQLGPKMTQLSPLVITRDLTWAAPIDVAYALVDSSLSAKLQRNMIILAKKMKMYDQGSKEFGRLHDKFSVMKGLVTKADEALLEKYKCKPMEARYTAMKAWDADLIEVSRLKRRLSKNKCKF
ncbi:MAG: hypothetical protein OQK24_01995 [Magnetovibrio sp.]|nr:hypothetical protein [Magnetovibrio sp.]